MTVKRYLNILLKGMIERYEKQINCRHKWKKYGHSYECRKCNYYTGLNTTLNKLIKKGMK